MRRTAAHRDGPMSRSRSEIELGRATRVIADLHLDTGDEVAADRFARWLAAHGHVSRLVILGDLFDVWVGPAQARDTAAPRVLDALAACSQKGTNIELVPGNRDFLLGADFEERTGARLHAEGFVGLAPGQRLLFVHGDTLCTKDKGYIRLRRVLRSRVVQWIAPRMPLRVGSGLARRLRRESVRALAHKLPDEKSIQRDAVVSEARGARCKALVCGHAHAHQDEMLEGGVRFVVVGAFGTRFDVLDIDERGELRYASSNNT